MIDTLPVASLDLEQTFAELLARARVLIPHDVSGVLLAASEADEGTHYPLWQGAPTAAAFGGVLRHARAEVGVPAVDSGYAAQIAAPLLSEGQPVGVIYLWRRAAEPFTSFHLDILIGLAQHASLALDQRALYRAMQARLLETTALLEVAAVAASSLNVDEMLRLVLRLAQRMLNVQSGAFLFHDRETHTLELRVGGLFGVPADAVGVRFDISAANNHVATVFTSGTPYWTNDVASATQDSQETYTALIARLRLRNLLLAPLRAQDEPMGVFLVGNKAGDFSRADAALLMAMGGHVAAALRNSDLLRALRLRLRETEALQRIAEITSATLEMDEMLERALHEAAELLEAEGALLMLPTARGRNGERAEDQEGATLALHEPSRFGLANDEYFTLPASFEEEIALAFSEGRPRAVATSGIVRTGLILPLRGRGRTSGALCFINRRNGSFGDGQLELARAITSQIATSLENAQLFAAERERADLMALVSRISQELTATLGMTELTQKVVRNIHERLRYEVVAIMLLDENGMHLTVRAAVSSIPGLRIAEGAELPITRGALGKAIRTGETQIVLDLAEALDYEPSFASQALPHGSSAVVPLRYGTRTLGAIEVLTPRPAGLRRADWTALETLATQVSVALENARLWDQTRRRILEQTIVHQISQDLSAILDYNELVNGFVKHMGRALDTAICVFASHDAESGQIVVEAEYNLPEFAAISRLPSYLTLPLNGAERVAIDQAIRTRRPVIGSVEGTRRHVQNIYAEFTQLVLPMIAGDRVIGCVLWIEVRAPREFSGGDVRLAQTLTTQAAIAIENARLFRQAQRQAHEQTLLRRVAVGLSNMPDLPTMLDQFSYEILHALPNISNVAIATRRADGGLEVAANYLTTCHPTDMFMAHLVGAPEAEVMLFAALESGASLQSGTILQTTTASALNTWMQRYLRERPVALLLTPIMRRRRELLGIIEISCDIAPRTFEAHEVQLLEALANQGAIAFDNISLHLREQRRFKQLERLQISSRNIARELQTGALLDVIVSEAADVFQVPAVSLMLRLPHSDTYEQRASIGLSARYQSERRTQVADFQDVRRFTRADQLRIVGDAEQDQLINAEGLTSVYAIPLLKGGQQLGLLNLYTRANPQDFTDEDRELMALFAGQAAIALENASLFEALEDRAVELAKANKLKSQFLARVSHELRTPMNSINGYSDMLLTMLYGPLNETQIDRVERINRNGKNLLALIDDLLDLSKIDAGKMQIQLAPVDLRAELQATIYTLESQATAKGLYLRVEVPDDLPPVNADAMRLRQVITNLLGNAIKFTKVGGVTLRAWLTPEAGEQFLCTSVIDTGIGIRPEDQKIIFDEFRQVDGSSTSEFGGTGLGLAISRRLVEMMAGRIWVDSKLDEGSAFTFMLPVARLADGPAA